MAGPIGILGAGSLGRLWAGHLPAGAAAFLPRVPAETILEPEPVRYRLQHIDGTDQAITVPWVSATSPELSLVLVTTKAGDASAALAAWLPRLAVSTPVVLFQNGMGSQQTIAGRWHQRPILAASTTEGANRPRPDLTAHAGKGETWIGGLTDSAKPLIQTVVQVLSTSGLNVYPDANIRQKLWDKLLINAGINAFTAILNCRNGEILEHPLYQTQIDNLCRELAAVSAAEGFQPLPPHHIRECIETVARNTAGNTSSMLSDRQQGRTTEIAFINGYLVHRGLAHGIPVPVNQMLTENVKQLTGG